MEPYFDFDMSRRFRGGLGALAALVSFTSAVPFGLQIYSCTTPGVIAPGFDDGPWIYSEDVLDRFVEFRPAVENLGSC